MSAGKEIELGSETVMGNDDDADADDDDDQSRELASGANKKAPQPPEGATF